MLFFYFDKGSSSACYYPPCASVPRSLVCGREPRGWKLKEGKGWFSRRGTRNIHGGPARHRRACSRDHSSDARPFEGGKTRVCFVYLVFFLFSLNIAKLFRNSLAIFLYLQEEVAISRSGIGKVLRIFSLVSICDFRVYIRISLKSKYYKMTELFLFFSNNKLHFDFCERSKYLN